MGLLNILFGNSSNDVKQYLDNNAVLIDVRTAGEYSGNNIPNTLNIPLQELEYRLDEVIKLQKPIIVYCASGMRSEQALKLLKSQGLDVINGGGISKIKAILKD